MKQVFSFFLFIGFALGVAAQNSQADSLGFADVVVVKDRRIDILGTKMYEHNRALSKNVRSGRGYRLMLLSTNDRNEAMQLRSKLLQQFPEHKVYMIFKTPFIKMKMGNFVEKDEAERIKKQLQAYRLVSGNIYVVPETIEIKPQDIDEED